MTVDEGVLRAARKVALDRNTSVNQLIREFLDQLISEQDRRAEARRKLDEFWRTAHAEVGPITWTRGDLHERGR